MSDLPRSRFRGARSTSLGRNPKAPLGAQNLFLIVAAALRRRKSSAIPPEFPSADRVFR